MAVGAPPREAFGELPQLLLIPDRKAVAGRGGEGVPLAALAAASAKLRQAPAGRNVLPLGHGGMGVAVAAIADVPREKFDGWPHQLLVAIRKGFAGRGRKGVAVAAAAANRAMPRQARRRQLPRLLILPPAAFAGGHGRGATGALAAAARQRLHLREVDRGRGGTCAARTGGGGPRGQGV